MKVLLNVSRILLLAVVLSTTIGFASQAANLPYLHTSGKNFVDPSGHVVYLHGVNLGGWLVTEGWMCGDQQGDRFMLERLEQRFGEAKAAELMNIWYDHWMTTADLDRIKSYGFNLVRVPFGYRNLQDAAGQWHRKPDGDIDFTRFDWIVNEAGKRGMYVIFDFHVWQGQQQSYPAISRLTSDGDDQRSKAAAIWSALARHFKGNGTVAAFDLFNEPEGSPGDALQRASYVEIRKQDPSRIVIGEAMYYTNFTDPYWTDAVWSSHYPVDDQPGTVEDKVQRWEKAATITDNPDVPAPIFIGEMKSPDDTQQSASDLVQSMNKRGWSWAVWCYKAVNEGGWASFNYYGTSVHYDSATDSYDTLKDIWSTKLTQWQDPSQPINYYINKWWIDGYSQK